MGWDALVRHGLPHPCLNVGAAVDYRNDRDCGTRPLITKGLQLRNRAVRRPYQSTGSNEMHRAFNRSGSLQV
jgi:hypothetical protein